ncbi:MAG: isochorismate synthase [Chlamydiae bacterium]|nr:isochorismate synthase [Chlamydiota bacterium]
MLASLLAGQSLFPKFYMRCKHTGEERMACGINMEQKKDACLYGVVPFQGDPLFFYPALEVRKEQEKVSFIAGKELCQEGPILSPYDSFFERIADLPTQEGWSLAIHEALQAIQRGELDKVVLARKTIFAVDPSYSPFAFLLHLLQGSINADVFAFQLQEDSPLFLGASPERLFVRKDNIVQTEAIAGTRKRGKTLEEDLALAQDLLEKTKDREEISHVETFLREKLSLLCESPVDESSLSLVKTQTVQHLHRSYRGSLRDGITDQNILFSLHPTPAVSGFPQQASLRKIALLESFSRGWYAGSLGWSSPLESHFTVAIRSACVDGSHLHAFAGTGIVTGSTPEAEWEELDHKLRHWYTHVPC